MYMQFNNTMMSEKKITVRTLNKAMDNSYQRAVRINKALKLDTVVVQGDSVVRISPDGSIKPIKKIDKKGKKNPLKPFPIK